MKILNIVQYYQLKKWIEYFKNNTQGLFLEDSVKGSKLSRKEVNRSNGCFTYQGISQILAGIESKNYSGHSLRSGFATSAAESGAEERNIMAMTGA